MLHDFGGNNYMFGTLVDVTNVDILLYNIKITEYWFQGPQAARTFSGQYMLGVGITMEGINQNEIMYEFALEQSWRTPLNSTELSDW
jgi:P2-related tail formation protein